MQKTAIVALGLACLTLTFQGCGEDSCTATEAGECVVGVGDYNGTVQEAVAALTAGDDAAIATYVTGYCAHVAKLMACYECACDDASIPAATAAVVTAITTMETSFSSMTNVTIPAACKEDVCAAA
jgi:hypothetical protein